MSQRNKRKWWEDDELAILDKSDGTRPIVQISGLVGDRDDERIYYVTEITSRQQYPASERSLSRPTSQQLQEARQNGWQLNIAAEPQSINGGIK